MRTTQQEIRRWLEEGRAKGASHTVVVCDTFDYEDYPVHVAPGQDVAAVVSEYAGKEMSQVMEVYRLDLDLEAQLGEPRAWHLESPAAAGKGDSEGDSEDDEGPEGQGRLRPSPLAG